MIHLIYFGKYYIIYIIIYINKNIREIKVNLKVGII